MENHRQLEPYRFAALAAHADADSRSCQLPPLAAPRAGPCQRVHRVELQAPVGSLHSGYREPLLVSHRDLAGAVPCLKSQLAAFAQRSLAGGLIGRDDVVVVTPVQSRVRLRLSDRRTPRCLQ